MLTDLSDDFGVRGVFEEYGGYLSKESEKKEELKNTVRKVEDVSREIHAVLQRLHRPGGVKDSTAITEFAIQKFSAIRELFKELDECVPEESYWKYSSLWSSTISWTVFLAAFAHYVKTEKLATRDEVAAMMGLVDLKALRLDVEEYLHGLCHLSNELSRFAVNSVTSEDYERPVKIAEFLAALNTGFRVLNLKNDSLRKKFDSIKYDIKKVEEVVYDLSIRGLKGAKEEAAPQKLQT